MNAVWISVAVFYALVLLLCWAICADSKRRAESQQRTRIVVMGAPSDRPVADALADAVADHLNAGGDINDIAGWQTVRHPSGAVKVTLILGSDAVDGAEQITKGIA